jgi:ketosteroid isomerase-like protein
MVGAEVVSRFWDRIEARDWDSVGRLLADDVEFEWPHSLERFRGRDAVVGMNRAYPEGWSIEVLRIMDAGEVVASEVRVPFRDESVFLVASFFEVRDRMIRRAVEYWVEAGGEDPPEWRRAFGDRMADPR